MEQSGESAKTLTKLVSQSHNSIKYTIKQKLLETKSNISNSCWTDKHGQTIHFPWIADMCQMEIVVNFLTRNKITKRTFSFEGNRREQIQSTFKLELWRTHDGIASIRHGLSSRTNRNEEVSSFGMWHLTPAEIKKGQLNN